VVHSLPGNGKKSRGTLHFTSVGIFERRRKNMAKINLVMGTNRLKVRRRKRPKRAHGKSGWERACCG
jgi:hypothetical protein